MNAPLSTDPLANPSTCNHVMIAEEFKASDYPTIAPGGFIRSVCKLCGATQSEYKTPQELEDI
jgi:hypothetical protein